VNALKKNAPRFGRDEWPYSFGLPDPTLGPMSFALAHASVIVIARSTSLIDRPRDLIETPQ
jgi:hypothetical protein